MIVEIIWFILALAVVGLCVIGYLIFQSVAFVFFGIKEVLKFMFDWRSK